ncbi:ribosomal protein L35 [Pneumocystis jirovecii RU7]|uniref:Ribosomal protein L35 n=1 Tax=Pneumocystis jirovecii (strain RU7) TaxID=1408657 RepID=A0A0W4ZHU4_PNEJ7|nr:ribosomal protein L35 [Pneumocystis jirovecii RU7]KTW27939.1 ribosomal protein L35 [Pneumocystis jirovecii RU7]
MIFLLKSSIFNICFNNSIKPLFNIITHTHISKTIKNTLKTHSGTKKRWSALPSGKFKRKKAGKTHLNSGIITIDESYIRYSIYPNSGKSSTRLNRLGKTTYADGGKSGPQTRHLKRLLPFN